LDDRRRDGGTNSTLRTKEQGTHLTLNEHDDDDDDDDELQRFGNEILMLCLQMWHYECNPNTEV